MIALADQSWLDALEVSNPGSDDGKPPMDSERFRCMRLAVLLTRQRMIGVVVLAMSLMARCIPSRGVVSWAVTRQLAIDSRFAVLGAPFDYPPFPSLSLGVGN